ncbi:MAG: presqualene diphosphate synthase HpnD [Bdellovibrionales bacterium]
MPASRPSACLAQNDGSPVPPESCAPCASPQAYDEAMARLKKEVKASRSSFLAGMMVLPRARREAMIALYAFCRIVDDIADDDGQTPEARATALQGWRKRIAALFQGEPEGDVAVALASAVTAYGLIEADFQAIIDGMEMDATAICAPDEAALDLYCDRVASAVGRVSVRIFGDSSAQAMQVAHHLGRAFQLTNILRDLSEDSLRDRLYLPERLLSKHKIASRKPKDVLRDPNLPAACRELAARAKAHFEEADAAMLSCAPQAMRPAKIMRAWYGAIFDRLVAEDWRDPARRVKLSKLDKLILVLRHMLRGL